MTLRQLFLHFTLAFIAGLVGLGVLASLLGIDPSTHINTAALAGASLYACSRFGEKNKRRLTAAEERKAWTGMLAIDLGIQLMFAALMALAGLMPAFFSGAMLLALAVVGLLHAALVIAMVKSAGRLFDKTQAAQQRKAAKQAARQAKQARPRPTAPMPLMQEQPNTVPMDLR